MSRLAFLSATLFLGTGSFLTGCVSDYPTASGSPEANRQAVLLDSLVSTWTRPDSTIHLYQPVLDPLMAGQPPAKAEVFDPVHVRERATGKVIRYLHTRQRFGVWSAELEFRWNHFMLQANFLYPQGLPDVSALAGRTDALYDEVRKSDRFTYYFDSASARPVSDGLSNSTVPGSLGIEVGLNGSGDSVVIRQVVPVSPAGRAGLAKGMVILAMDGRPVTGDSAIERFYLFSEGDSGQACNLRLLTSAGERSHLLVREPVAFPTVYVDSLGGVGYIAVTAFLPSTVGGRTTALEFREALEATRGFKVTILDLRDNGGGSVDQALRMCDEILPAGVPIIRQYQRMFSETEHAPLVSTVTHLATSQGTAEHRRFVLIGNGRSASAGELFLLAIKEGAGAPLVGQKTYGKGVGQNLKSTPGKGLVLLTYVKFIGLGGLDYHMRGIQPDYPDSATGEKLLLEAVEVAQGVARISAKRGSGVSRTLSGRALAAEWNRLQAGRPGVRDMELEADFPSPL